MPITEKSGDLLQDTEINVILHQANIYHVFGGGIAKVIKDVFPEAYDADCTTPKGDIDKLGTYSRAMSGDKMIVNCYSQRSMGASDDNTSYDAILKIFLAIEEKVADWNKKNPTAEKVLGVPYGYGSSLAGGRWTIVEAIFRSIFQDSPVKLVIVRLPGLPDLK